MVGYQNMSKEQRAAYMREWRKAQPKKRRPLDRSKPKPTRRRGRDMAARLAYIGEWRRLGPKSWREERKRPRRRGSAYMRQYMRWYRDQQRDKSATIDTETLTQITY